MSRCLWSLLFLTLPTLVGAAEIPEFPAEQIEFFEKQIRPLLVERCQKCHNGEKQEGGLRLDSRPAVLKGGDTGPSIVPGTPDQSELILAISYDPAGYQMPPDAKLSASEIAALTKWVELGAPWPASTAADNAVAGRSWDEEFARRRQHWSFQPLVRPALPDVRDREWSRSPLDRFILSRLEENRLTPAAEADRRTWLRRVTLDVTGLLPTTEECNAFLADDMPGAHERVIERLLASPHFGERWSRHWLDLVRYAESRGHEYDFDVANAWQYRDYVIRAMNADVPYDRLVTEHIAGDLLPREGTTQPDQFARRLDPQTGANESILGTGFWFLGEWVHSPVDIRQEEAERFDNMIDVYSKTFLGLTVACARCHDHKFDPISTKDFYALQGYLQSSTYRHVGFETMEQNRRLADDLMQLRREATPVLLETWDRLAEPVTGRLSTYLLTAADLLRSQPQIEPQTDHERLATAAAKADLDPILLGKWIRHLQAAAEQQNDPLYDWARYATKRLLTFEALQAQLADDQRRFVDDNPGVQAALKNRPDDDVFRAHELLIDGEGFVTVSPTDSNPVALLSDAPDRPLRRMLSTSAIQWDSAWPTPILRGDGEPGAMEKWNRAGRTIRTPGFEITDDHIYCSVRGSVNLYVAVDSHNLVRGPLHGSLTKSFPTPEGNHGWRWVAMNVSRYKGHRAHVELVPADDAEFGVSLIFQSNRPPATPRPSLLPRAFAESPESLAEAIALLLHRDWMFEHPELFGLDASSAVETLRTVSQPFLIRQQSLLKQVRRETGVAPAMGDGPGENEYVFIRGNWKKPGDVVPRRFLEVFHGEGPEETQGSGRLELARQMVDPDQTPILARVIVNRIWQHYFGRGLVPTPDDFGYLGQPPSHPELLDWLATELIAHNWSLKHIHQIILASSTYRLASAHTGEGDAASEIDPGNVLLSRMNVKRMQGEIIRDTVLHLSGRLDPRLYGRSVPVHLTPFMEGRGRPKESGPIDGHGRRSIYLSVRRNFAEPFFQAFDFPNPHTTIGRRNVSNVPAQALAMMNNPLIVQQSRAWVMQMLQETPNGTTSQRIDSLYQSALSRAPSADELTRGERFLSLLKIEKNVPADDPALWTDYAHVLLNTKEFLFVR